MRIRSIAFRSGSGGLRIFLAHHRIKQSGKHLPIICQLTGIRYYHRIFHLGDQDFTTLVGSINPLSTYSQLIFTVDKSKLDGIKHIILSQGHVLHPVSTKDRLALRRSRRPTVTHDWEPLASPQCPPFCRLLPNP